jgi:hypothetical protein
MKCLKCGRLIEYDFMRIPTIVIANMKTHSCIYCKNTIELSINDRVKIIKMVNRRKLYAEHLAEKEGGFKKYKP